jgi:hypothetical protein
MVLGIGFDVPATNINEKNRLSTTDMQNILMYDLKFKKRKGKIK